MTPDNPDSIGTYAGYVVGGAGVLLAVGQMAWNKFFSTEAKTSDALLEQVTARLASQETRLLMLENGLDAERELRRKSEDEVHNLKLQNSEQRAELVRQITALEMDNVALRAELRRHGIDVPDAVVATPITMQAPQ